MDNDDNKFDVQPQSLMIQSGRLLVSDRWLCSRFGIPYRFFYSAVMSLGRLPFSTDLRFWIDESDFNSLMTTPVGSYFTTDQADAVSKLLQGKRG